MPRVTLVDGPPDIGCVVLGDHLWDPIALSLSPSGSPGLALRGEMEVQIQWPVGPAEHVFVQLTERGLSLRGWSRADDVVVHSQKPVVVGGFVVPYTTTPLHVSSAQAGRAVVSLAPGGLATDDVVTGAVSCERLALAPDRGGLHEQPGGVPWHEGEQEFATLTTFPVPLSLEPDGPPVATLVGEPPRAVIAFGSTPTETRIAIFVSNATLFGWVPSAAVGEGQGPASPPGTSRQGKWSRTTTAMAPSSWRRCEAPLPVVLEVEGGRRVVGELAPDTLVEVESHGEPFRRFRWPSASMMAGTLLLPAEDVQRCAETVR